MDCVEYLKGEYRCEFYVDEKRKALWKGGLDLLDSLDAICQKYGLKYFLIAGGMLGAVRHKGFIPWDDDIDLAMPREDYDQFMRVAQDELPNPLFLQTGLNEKMYFDPITRIRDPRTTGIVRKDLHSTCNNGVFIEIFPYDNVPDQEAEAKKQDFWIRFYKMLLIRSVYEMLDENPIKRTFMNMLADLAVMVWGREGIYRKYDSWCRKYNSFETMNRNILTAYSYRNTFRYKQSVMQDHIRVPFEYTHAYIPREYDECLTQVYHDYMKYPPVEKRGAKHEDIVFYDATVDYKTYLKMIRNGQKQLCINNKKGIKVRRKKKW